MSERAGHELLWVWTVGELLLVVALFWLLAASLLGETTLLSSMSRTIRLGAVAFLAVELLIPLWVFFDLRRRPDDPGSFWMHVAAMPGINIFGLLAYLQARKLEQE